MYLIMINATYLNDKVTSCKHPENDQRYLFVKIDCTYALNNKQLRGGGGVQAFQFRKHDFDLWVGGHGLDMFQQLQGGFGSMRAILPISGLRAKNGSKTGILDELIILMWSDVKIG